MAPRVHRQQTSADRPRKSHALRRRQRSKFVPELPPLRSQSTLHAGYVDDALVEPLLSRSVSLRPFLPLAFFSLLSLSSLTLRSFSSLTLLSLSSLTLFLFNAGKAQALSFLCLPCRLCLLQALLHLACLQALLRLACSPCMTDRHATIDAVDAPAIVAFVHLIPRKMVPMTVDVACCTDRHDSKRVRTAGVRGRSAARKRQALDAAPQAIDSSHLSPSLKSPEAAREVAKKKNPSTPHTTHKKPRKSTPLLQL